MAKVYKTAEARREIKELGRYLTREAGFRTAKKELLRIERRLDLLTTFPNSGTPMPELGPDVRRVVVRPYSLFYEPLPDGVRLLHVYRSRDYGSEDFG